MANYSGRSETMSRAGHVNSPYRAVSVAVDQTIPRFFQASEESFASGDEEGVRSE
jgi:hypothetical protein